MGRAPFIALEGIDGSGKTTQCPLLTDWLKARGYEVVRCADPGGTSIGDHVRSLLLHHHGTFGTRAELFLFMASRAELTDEIVRPALEKKHAVVSDRFLLSNVVYQGHAGGLDPAEVWRIGLFATGGIEPDLSLVLDMPVPEALVRRRRSPDRVERRDIAYHEAVRRGFLEEATRRPDRIRIVDGTPPVEAVHERIIQEVMRVLATGTRA